MNIIQEQFNINTSSDFIIDPNEYEGPLTIDRPCILNGSNSTLWSDNKPVLIINSPNVVIKDLRVECTKNTDNTEPVIITSGADTKLINVEVNGNIKGFPDESELWELPNMITLGSFASNKQNTFLINIPAAENAQIQNNINNVHLSAKTLLPGNNNIIITTDELRDNSILYGEIFIKTTVSRRIYITGKALKNAPLHQDSTAAMPQSISADSLPSKITVPCSVAAPPVSDSSVIYIKKGQRLPIKDIQDKVIKIVYEHKSLKQNIDIDAYVFLLQTDEKALDDSSLIFFGNPQTDNESVKVLSSDNNMPLVLIELNKLESWTDKAVVCYSIYGDDTGQNFSLVNSPVIRIISEETELYRFELSGLNIEKTIIAVEFYRYKGIWKINFIGSGYKQNLKILCENYGINVD